MVYFLCSLLIETPALVLRSSAFLPRMPEDKPIAAEQDLIVHTVINMNWVGKLRFQLLLITRSSLGVHVRLLQSMAPRFFGSADGCIRKCLQSSWTNETTIIKERKGSSYAVSTDQSRYLQKLPLRC